MTDKRIIAIFHPQVWIEDSACAADAEGATEFDVTETVLAMGKEAALALKDDRYSTDDLRNDSNAPAWIKNWSGPFWIEVEDSIEQYYTLTILRYADWQYEVANGDTRLGFADWLEHNPEEDGITEAAKPEVFCVSNVGAGEFQSVFPTEFAGESAVHSSMDDAWMHIAQTILSLAQQGKDLSGYDIQQELVA